MNDKQTSGIIQHVNESGASSGACCNLKGNQSLPGARSSQNDRTGIDLSAAIRYIAQSTLRAGREDHTRNPATLEPVLWKCMKTRIMGFIDQFAASPARHWMSTIIAFCLANHILFAQVSRVWGDLKPGEYPVGFSVLQKYDTSRRWRDEEKGRPIQISIWYPAGDDGTALPLTYRDYFLLSASELEFAEPSGEMKAAAVAKYEDLLVSNGIPRAAAESLFSTRMYARPDIPVARGSFPLLIVAQGNFHSAHHQSILCEFLASHGYVVATCPSQTRISGPMKSDEDLYHNVLEQSGDIAFVRKQVGDHFRIDDDRVGLVSHSFSARSALFYLADNKEVRALVSLDGGIGNKQGKDFMNGKKGFDPGAIRAPLLHFYEDVESFMTPDFDLINSLKNSDRFLIRVEQMNHAQFTGFGMAGGTIPGFSIKPEETRLKCEAIYNITLRFLDAFVKDREVGAGEQFLKEIRQILPREFMSISRLDH